MRKSFLLIVIFFFSISAKSQNLKPEFTKALQEFFFIPVEFENFGEWMSSIETDSSIEFKKRVFTLENDSINLEFDLKNSQFSSPIKGAQISAQVFGRTSEFKNLSTLKTNHNSLTIEPLPSKKVTSIKIYPILTFDSTSEGKLLASEAQKMLKEKFAEFFDKKNVLKKYNSKKYSRVVRAVGFINKKEVVSRFSIWNSTFPDRNQVALYLLHELKDTNIENKH